MRKLTQLVALGAVTCSTMATAAPVLADSSAALGDGNFSTITNSAAKLYGTGDSGSATGDSLAGIGFKEGTLYLYGPPNFNFGTHPMFSELEWNLIPSGAPKFNGRYKDADGKYHDSNNITDNTVGIGDFRSYQHNGWSLSVSVGKFYDVNDPETDLSKKRWQPIQSMIFKQATLMKGHFLTNVSQEAIDKSWIGLSPASGASGMPDDAPANFLASPEYTSASGYTGISVYPKGSSIPHVDNAATIWYAKDGTKGTTIQGKGPWGLSFLKYGDVELIPKSRYSQIDGNFKADMTWTLQSPAVI